LTNAAGKAVRAGGTNYTVVTTIYANDLSTDINPSRSDDEVSIGLICQADMPLPFCEPEDQGDGGKLGQQAPRTRIKSPPSRSAARLDVPLADPTGRLLLAGLAKRWHRRCGNSQQPVHGAGFAYQLPTSDLGKAKEELGRP